MRGFDVLDPRRPLQRRVFLEASAGTGKTFTIEHLVVRFLLEEEELDISQILLVTFTKAATAELRYRVRSNLEKILQNLFSASAPDYIVAKQKENNQALFFLEKKLKRALANFDEAPIFTIHSFCFHCLQEQGLEGNLSFDQTEESASFFLFQNLAKDFLRTQINEDLLHPFQLDQLFQMYQYDIAKFATRLAELAAWRLPIQGGKKAETSLQAYEEQLVRLREKYSFSKEQFLEDLEALSLCYGGLCDRQKNLKPESKIALKRMVEALCEQKSIDPFLLQFHAENRLKRPFSGTLHYPGLLEEMQEKLMPIVAEYSDPLSIEACVAEEFRKWIEPKITEKGLIFFEDLILMMSQKVEEPTFAKRIRNCYKAVLIDEFQDTDPQQWKIFSSLFLSHDFPGYLYIVGDPKQSIYRFRNADLYTYLKAKKALPEESHSSLDTNYRSTPTLVESLNKLFHEATDCFSLPRLEKSLLCPPVKAGIEKEWTGSDGRKSIHFCLAEEEQAFYPFLANEILALNVNEGISFGECAVLVKDRFQANRVRSFLHHLSIPSVTKRSHLLTQTQAFDVLQDLLKAVLSPQDQNALKIALGGPLFFQELEVLCDPPLNVFKEFHEFYFILKKEGILSFFSHLMKMEGRREKLFSREGGLDLFLDLQQLVELIAMENLSIDHLLPFIEKLKYANEDTEKYKAHQRGVDHAVQILTIHVSKGLEFDIVFPIGLILASPIRKEMVRDEEKLCLTSSEKSLKLHAQESDAEKMRQLYVAVTRAKKRLYLPVLKNEKKKESLSPMALFLDKVLKGRSLENFASSIGASCSEMNVSFQNKRVEESKEHLTLTSPKPVHLSFASWEVYSYSSLKRVNFSEEKKERESNRMPSGPEVGHLLHRLIEEIPFEKAFLLTHPNEFISYVAPFLGNTVLEGWENEVCRVLHSAFQTPLPDKEGSFPLSAVNPKKMVKEMEFLYPSKHPSGFLKGFVDLFFEHKGKFYFLDWKSNDLQNYHSNALEVAMNEHDYFLQAELYQTALQRYIKIFNNVPRWGGGFYIFLRGLPEGIYKI